MEKQKMLYQQARLHDRGAAEMVLQMISASKGGEVHAFFLRAPFLTSSVCGYVATRSSRRHGDCHPQIRHFYPERGEHPGPAGTPVHVLHVCDFTAPVCYRLFLSRCRKCWTT